VYIQYLRLIQQLLRGKEKNRTEEEGRKGWHGHSKSFRYLLQAGDNFNMYSLQDIERRMKERERINARRAEREGKKIILGLQKRGDHIPIGLLTLKGRVN
jgi:hypothetical protein